MDHIEDLFKRWDKSEGAPTIYWMYASKAKSKEADLQNPEIQNEDDEKHDYRKEIQGKRNAKYLKRARFYSQSAKALKKKDHTDLHNNHLD